MKIARIDGSTVRTPEELHNCLQDELEFPEYYGKNLDALYDVLTDLPDETWIYISAEPALRSVLGEYWERFLRVFSDAQQENARLKLVLLH